MNLGESANRGYVVELEGMRKGRRTLSVAMGRVEDGMCQFDQSEYPSHK